MSIWDVDYIKRLAHPDDSTWDFEISGSERSSRMKDRLCSIAAGARYPISYYCTAVNKGKWEKEAVKLCRANGIKPDLKRRKMELQASKAEPWLVSLIDIGDETMTGGRLQRVREYLGSETFCMTYGDGISDINIWSM